MSGERLARASLALDAIFCSSVGILFIVLRARLAGILRLPVGLVVAAGVAIIGWATVVLGQTVRIEWRSGAKQTAAVNAAASALLGLGAALHPSRGARAFLVVSALEVGSFAVAQVISLLRRPR